jgi:hypothetical protein
MVKGYIILPLIFKLYQKIVMDIAVTTMVGMTVIIVDIVMAILMVLEAGINHKQGQASPPNRSPLGIHRGGSIGVKIIACKLIQY